MSTHPNSFFKDCLDARIKGEPCPVPQTLPPGLCGALAAALQVPLDRLARAKRELQAMALEIPPCPKCAERRRNETPGSPPVIHPAAASALDASLDYHNDFLNAIEHWILKNPGANQIILRKLDALTNSVLNGDFVLPSLFEMPSDSRRIPRW